MRRGLELRCVHLLAHQRQQGRTQIEAVRLEHLFNLLVGAVVAQDGAEHVVGAHVHGLRLDPFGGGAVEGAVAHERRLGAARVVVDQPVDRVAIEVAVELRAGAHAFAELVGAQTGAMGDVRAREGEARRGARRGEGRGRRRLCARKGGRRDAKAGRGVDGARRVVDGRRGAVGLPRRGRGPADDGMATGRRRARAAAGVAIAPEAVEHNVLERLAREARRRAQQLLEAVRLVLVVERLVVQHGQRQLVQVVGHHAVSNAAVGYGVVRGGADAQARSAERQEAGG